MVPPAGGLVVAIGTLLVGFVFAGFRRFPQVSAVVCRFPPVCAGFATHSGKKSGPFVPNWLQVCPDLRLGLWEAGENLTT